MTQFFVYDPTYPETADGETCVHTIFLDTLDNFLHFCERCAAESGLDVVVKVKTHGRPTDIEYILELCPQDMGE